MTRRAGSLGAATLVEVAGSAAATESLRKDCDVGDAAACAALSEELDAGRARLDALDSWGAVSTAVATVAVEVTLQTAAGMPADEIAKAAWLVSLDTAAWARPQSEALREMDLRNEGRPGVRWTAARGHERVGAAVGLWADSPLPPPVPISRARPGRAGFHIHHQRRGVCARREALRSARRSAALSSARRSAREGGRNSEKSGYRNHEGKNTVSKKRLKWNPSMTTVAPTVLESPSNHARLGNMWMSKIAPPQEYQMWGWRGCVMYLPSGHARNSAYVRTE